MLKVLFTVRRGCTNRPVACRQSIRPLQLLVTETIGTDTQALFFSIALPTLLPPFFSRTFLTGSFLLSS